MRDRSTIELVAGPLGRGGDAEARLDDGRRVLVRGAVPGDQIRARIVRSTPSYDVAELQEILKPSSNRCEPPCANVARGCGGCQWQHVVIAAQRSAKIGIVDAALRAVGLDPPADSTSIELEPWHYRTTIRAEVRDGTPSFFGFRSDTVVPAAGCLIAHPLLGDLLAATYEGARQVILRCGVRTGERMAWVVPAPARLRVSEEVGRPFFHESAAGRTWRVSARSFFQARPDGVDFLAQIVQGRAEEMEEPRTFVDLYSGVGVFAGVLAERGWSGTAIEGSASAVRDARHNLAGLDVVVEHEDVARCHPPRVALAVADPSRAGLGARGAKAMLATGARRIVLVSCDARNLARDARRIVDAGYALTAQTVVDLFPQTFHVEVVSVFDRVG